MFLFGIKLGPYSIIMFIYWPRRGGGRPQGVGGL